MLWASLAVHAVVLLLAMVAPTGRYEVPAGVVSVELVSLPSSASAPRPAAAPEAAPEPAKPVAPPPPAPPRPEQVVLPKQPTEPPKPKPKVEPKPEPRPQPRREVVLEPQPRQEKSLEELLGEMREESGEAAPAAPAAPAKTASAQAAGPAGAGGTGRPVSPEVAEWIRRAKVHVQRSWVLAPTFRTEPLETHVMVDLDASGNVRGEPEITRRSGNPWYDESVVHGVQKASPLPAPPEAGEWPFVFVPQDAY